jgi:pyruvate dehydrogenase E1 component alpha subunit
VTAVAAVDLAGHISEDDIARLYHWLVIARRFDTQAIALARQGRLAVYPSARGQEAAQVGATLALHPDDWMFPTYRETVATVVRGVDPAEALALLRGSWHCGWNPMKYRIAPQCTPLATQTLHAAGLADAARRRGDHIAVLVFLGDGATSEGDAHEAMNFAAVWNAPVVFFVQNNQYAISVPLSKQTKARTIAQRGEAYDIPAVRIDGNDILAVYAASSDALARARGGDGPTIIEAVTYRIEAHTTADDAHRYRSDDEVAAWHRRDPVDRFERVLANRGLLDDAMRARASDAAEEFAARVREELQTDPSLTPTAMFDHVYSELTPQLREQRALLERELAD